jgi:hypothetical protein
VYLLRLPREADLRSGTSGLGRCSYGRRSDGSRVGRHGCPCGSESPAYVGHVFHSFRQRRGRSRPTRFSLLQYAEPGVRVLLRPDPPG